MTAALLAGARPRPWLAPLGALFGGAAAVRAALYRRGVLARERLGRPVISVGNLAVGGRGKTPLVELTARLLRDAGHRVSVLSRGYAGAFRGEALVVSDGERVRAEAAEAGDEPVMLARALPGVAVAVGRDRARLGRVVEERLAPAVHVLDDGFQHLRLERDLDIVCLDAGDLGERPLPAGTLREGVAALERAHLLAVGGEEEAAAEAARDALCARFGAERVLRLRRIPDGFRHLEGAPAAAPRRALLLSGIARPERLAADVAAQGVEVAGHAAFPDHHRFQAGEVEAVLLRARQAGAEVVVTTAKDAVRLPLPAGGPPVLVFRVRAAVEDEPRLRERLLATVRGR